MPFVADYTKALGEFEKLTNAQAQTLKNKGKESGLKKINVLFKSGKTLEQRAAAFDKALDTPVTIKTTPAQAKTVVKVVVEAHAKFSEGLKKNRDEFTKGIAEFGNEKDVQAGYQVFVKRLEQMRHEAKGRTDQKLANLNEIITGKALTGDAKVAADIKRAYIGIKGGADETEALIKLFVARPSVAGAYELLTNTKGPRSLGVGVTSWKKVAEAHPDLAAQLRADPVHLLKPVYDLTQNKGEPFWKDKLKIGDPGWENRVKAQAAELARVVTALRRSADEIKALL